jgi:hypothetical protein
MNLSPEEEKAIQRFNCSLVAKLLLGPISEVRGESWISGRIEDDALMVRFNERVKGCVRRRGVFV